MLFCSGTLIRLATGFYTAFCKVSACVPSEGAALAAGFCCASEGFALAPATLKQTAVPVKRTANTTRDLITRTPLSVIGCPTLVAPSADDTVGNKANG